MLHARINATKGDDVQDRTAARQSSMEQMVAAAIERLALGSLRIALVLLALTALGDTMIAALSGAGTALLVCGATLTALALSGTLWPHRAAALLRARGRIVLAAGLLAALGMLIPGLQSSYSDTEMAIACLAAVLASPVWVLTCVMVLAAGAILDPASAGGHSLAWTLTGEGGDALAGQLAGLCVGAALTLGAISALRRSIVTAPASLCAVEHGGGSLTPALAAAARSTPAGLLARPHPAALTAALSEAERRVLGLLAGGLAPKQAAHRLGLQLPTIRSHIASAKRKTGARTLEQLVGLYAEAASDI